MGVIRKLSPPRQRPLSTLALPKTLYRFRRRPLAAMPTDGPSPIQFLFGTSDTRAGSSPLATPDGGEFRGPYPPVRAFFREKTRPKKTRIWGDSFVGYGSQCPTYHALPPGVLAASVWGDAQRPPSGSRLVRMGLFSQRPAVTTPWRQRIPAFSAS